MKYIQKLLDVMAALRDPETGCPWDVEQDFRSIAPYTIEEAYEVADAIDREAMLDLRDELGDLLLQVVFHSQIAREAGHLEFEDVAQAIVEKMVRRHPHVFGDETVSSAVAQRRPVSVSTGRTLRASGRKSTKNWKNSMQHAKAVFCQT